MDLPTFRYHPDPIGTESIEESDEACIVCGQARGHIYIGPVYAIEEYDDCICPWCIADGSAHRKLHADFTDPEGIGGYERTWCAVAKKVIQEVAFRTPGFNGWQQEEWFTHCDDAAAFLGRFGYAELLAMGEAAVEAIREGAELGEDEEWEEFLESLDKDGSPTAYLFRCLHCGQYGGYADYD